ncbi:hypothetical protein SCORR_v1c03030 [Spiroplasma corruscae]|uniref:Uncharacterized protein n=1 Tax=Spiroplasma corruscae TaxID=216934 RepID=A0A222ENL4_9MOLU|nr:hypothetical protein [Spiroplasma corruscae]ASP28077.1 hypothetical protein SCORR_v1c03030 [Spiroplasma corruscae]
MNCCKCDVNIVKNCICAINNCECDNNDSYDCWCCIEKKWHSLISTNGSFNYVSNILENSIKNKSIEKLIRYEFSMLKKDILSNKKNIVKDVSKSYVDLIDTEINPKLIVEAFHANLITKLIYFVNEVSYYLEVVNLAVEIYPTFKLNINYNLITLYLESVDEILPFIVGEFKTIVKEVYNSFEYEMLKSKLFNLDELVVRIKDKIEVKTINYE